MSRHRLSSVALAVAGVLFLLYPVVRPWNDESTAAGAIAAMSSGRWVASHLFAMIGFILVPLGLLAVRSVVARTPAESLAVSGVLTTWVGVGLTLPYYGAEDFGLNAIASAAAAGEAADLLGLVDDVRFNPVAATMFALGLLSIGVGAVLTAVAVARSGVLPRSSGLLFAVGFALFIPQFWAPGPVRIAHGLVVAVGAIQLSVALWQAPAGEDAQVAQTRSTVTFGGNSRSANRPMA